MKINQIHIKRTLERKKPMGLTRESTIGKNSYKKMKLTSFFFSKKALKCLHPFHAVWESPYSSFMHPESEKP